MKEGKKCDFVSNTKKLLAKKHYFVTSNKARANFINA